MAGWCGCGVSCPALEGPGRPVRAENHQFSRQPTRLASPQFANSQRPAHRLEVCRPARLPRHTFLRLFLQFDSSLRELALHGARGGRGPACAGLLDLDFLDQAKRWFLAGAIYLTGFAATANLLVPTGTIMGERLAYLPSAGFCLLAALLWLRLENYQRRLAWAVLAIVAATLAARTVVRNRDWQDNFSPSGRRWAVPGSAKMHFALGSEYMNRGELRQPSWNCRPPSASTRTIPRPWSSAGSSNPSWSRSRGSRFF